jgi:zinc transport system permease protein
MSMLELLSHEFMQNAVMAAMLASVACGMIGTLVVVNRLVFLAGGVAHAAYGGVGLAFFFGLPVLPCTVGFTLVASTIMAGVTLRNKERSETVIGVMWAAGMALGILLLDITPGYNVDLMSYLFGSILTVPVSDIRIMFGLDVFIVAMVLYFYRDFLVMSFEPEFARTRGVPVTLLYFTLLGMIALSVVMIIQVVGLILVIALLTIPPYMAQGTSRSLMAMMVRAVTWSLFFCLTGLWLACLYDLTSGASIIAVATVCFFGKLLWEGIRVKC